VLKNTKGPEATRRAALLPQLQNLYGVYKSLFAARQKRGAIDFDTTETYIVCNAQGKIEQIIPRTRNDAHKLIEECMLAANVCAADFMKRNKHPGLYRVHAGPTAEKLENLRTFLRGMGLTLGGGDSPHASDYAALMAHIRDRPDAQMLQTMLLRSMQQAVYSPDNIGHFGLAYEAYAHFTSPIRRYPDLLTHRAIYAVLQGRKYTPEAPHGVDLNTALSPRARAMQQADDEKRGRTRSNNVAIWEELGLHCSANERRADEASRDVEAWLKCYFMRDKLGEEYGGMVSGVTSFGIFVQLDALFIEGLVHVTELGSDYFQYDEIKNELRGERTGIRYRLSDRVRVQVSRVDLDARKIDFRPKPVQGHAARRPHRHRRSRSRRRARHAAPPGNTAPRPSLLLLRRHRHARSAELTRKSRGESAPAGSLQRVRRAQPVQVHVPVARGLHFGLSLSQ
jgi:ribonuclease R